MTDDEVERVLFDTPATAQEATRLWYRPDGIVVRRLGDGDTRPDGHVVQVDHLYLAMPLTDGRVVTKVSPRAAALVAATRELRGTYAVYWASAPPADSGR
jgi:hypothetical protein